MPNLEREFAHSMEEKIWLAFPVKEQIHITDMYSLFRIHYLSGFAFPGETHNFWECVYVVRGSICVSADERVYNLEDGDIIFHKPLEFHKFNVTSENGADLLIFSFTAEGPLTGWLRDKVFRLSEYQQSLVSSMTDFMESKSQTLTAATPEHHYLTAFDRIPYYSQMVITYLNHLLLSLADESTIASVSSAPDALTFSKAISYLNSNLHRQTSVSEIARFSNVSESGLKRIFEKFAGISVHRYLLKLKIKAAIELLQDGENVSNVAERIGFGSQSYFSKAFKRETGVTPSEFKTAESPERSK